MSDSPKPLPRVSAKHYAPQPAAAKVRFRAKGSPHEGDVYHGQKLIIPCKGCGKHQSTLAKSP